MAIVQLRTRSSAKYNWPPYTSTINNILTCKCKKQKFDCYLTSILGFKSYFNCSENSIRHPMKMRLIAIVLFVRCECEKKEERVIMSINASHSIQWYYCYKVYNGNQSNIINSLQISWCIFFIFSNIKHFYSYNEYNSII